MEKTSSDDNKIILVHISTATVTEDTWSI